MATASVVDRMRGQFEPEVTGGIFRRLFPGQIPDDPGIAETRQYLRDFIRLDQTTDSPRALFDAMIELYPDRANPGSLWGGANAAKS